MLFEVHYYAMKAGPSQFGTGAGSRRFTDTGDFIAWLHEMTVAGYVIAIDWIRDIT